MIFLSHNWKDKTLVEPIAIRLAETFGQENVFYDSWSIQPGDGIIDKMNTGLSRAKFFFLFVSSNSLESKMVDLEWQNALMGASKGSLRFVPIRLDASSIPPILTQTAHLDLYKNGLENVLRQVVDLAKGENTFSPQFKEFSNFEASIDRGDDELLITVKAIHYMEPRCEFLIFTESTDAEIEISAVKQPMYTQSFKEKVAVHQGVDINGFFIGVPSALVPGFPFRIKMKDRRGVAPSFRGLLYEKGEELWVPIRIGGA